MTEESCRKFLSKFQKKLSKKDVSDAELKKAFKTLARLLKNVLNAPDNPKFRLIKTDNPAISTIFENNRKLLQYLILVGFTDKSKKENKFELVGELAPSELDTVYRAYMTLVETCVKSFSKGGFSMSVESFPGYVTGKEFNPYKTIKFSTNSLSKEKKKPAQGSRFEKALKKLYLEREQIMESAGLPKRYFVAFTSLSEAMKFQKEGEESSDEENSKIVRKANKRLVMLAKRAQDKQSKRSKQFSTLAMREFEKLKDQPVFTRALIRVKFPDGTVLQAFFSPREKVSDVISYFAQYLKTKSDMYLFMAPPKKILEEDMSLEDAKLLPCVRLYAGFHDSVPDSLFKRTLTKDLEAKQWKNIRNKEKYTFSSNFIKYVKVSV